jgi:hypothetical protein
MLGRAGRQACKSKQVGVLQEVKEMQAGKVTGWTGSWTRPGWSSGRQEAGEAYRSCLGTRQPAWPWQADREPWLVPTLHALPRGEGYPYNSIGCD